MKNTVKKILALVFVVAMVCSLAVPAFAANGDDKVDVKVTVVLPDGSVAVDHASVALEAKKANVESALKATDDLKAALTVNTAGKISHIKNNGALTKVTADAIVGEFGTGSVVVAVNGKAVSEDLGTVAVEEDDIITVYWADSTLGTKLAMVDDSAIAHGIISLYYYDAEGNRQPLKGAKISLKSAANNNDVLRDRVNVFHVVETSVAGAVDDEYDDYEYHFTADEKGQIWIAPEYLDNGDVFTIAYAITNVAGAADTVEDSIIAKLDKISKDDGYTQKEVDYYNARLNRNIVDVEVISNTVVVDADLYDVAGATGDMTVVYALVAFVAVATIVAVVVMKKKSVKAN